MRSIKVRRSSYPETTSVAAHHVNMLRRLSKKAGFNAVIAGSYAEIFFGNSTTLGIVCVEADDATRAGIVEAMAIDPSGEMEIDVDACKVSINGKSFDVSIKENARKAFLAGNYDSLADLLGNMEDVIKLEAGLKYAFKA